MTKGKVKKVGGGKDVLLSKSQKERKNWGQSEIPEKRSKWARGERVLSLLDRVWR